MARESENWRLTTMGITNSRRTPFKPRTFSRTRRRSRLPAVSRTNQFVPLRISIGGSPGSATFETTVELKRFGRCDSGLDSAHGLLMLHEVGERS